MLRPRASTTYPWPCRRPLSATAVLAAASCQSPATRLQSFRGPDVLTVGHEIRKCTRTCKRRVLLAPKTCINQPPNTCIKPVPIAAVLPSRHPIPEARVSGEWKGVVFEWAGGGRLGVGARGRGVGILGAARRREGRIHPSPLYISRKVRLGCWLPAPSTPSGV